MYPVDLTNVLQSSVCESQSRSVRIGALLRNEGMEKGRGGKGQNDFGFLDLTYSLHV
jgi:hypothetical protein